MVADAAKTLCHPKAILRRIERNNQGNERLEPLAIVRIEQCGPSRLALQTASHGKVLRHQGIHRQMELRGENTLFGKLAPDRPTSTGRGNENKRIAQIDRTTLLLVQQKRRNLCGKGIFLCEGDQEFQCSEEDTRSVQKAESGGCH